MSSSSVVFVGNGFVRQLFNEQELFPEAISKDHTAFGPIAEYAYGSNTYRFAVMPDRIVLQHNSDAVFSEELVAAAQRVADTLQAQSQGHGVAGLGLNLEAVFTQSDGGRTGREFCRDLCAADRVQHAIGSTFHDAQFQVVVLSGGVQYTLRIEPHIDSRGANLFFAVNGHQNVAPTDDLPSKLNRAGSIRDYALSASGNLARDFGGGGE